MKIREVKEEDSFALCELLNEIIVIGGTTAFEHKLEKREFANYFVNGEELVHSIVAIDQSECLGFQCLSYHSELPNGWLDIATFARARPKTVGVGTALFNCSLEYIRHTSFSYINATIRADNKSGLAYYTKMGFKNYTITENVPLSDGTLVDRISKKYQLNCD